MKKKLNRNRLISPYAKTTISTKGKVMFNRFEHFPKMDHIPVDNLQESQHKFDQNLCFPSLNFECQDSVLK